MEPSLSMHLECVSQTATGIRLRLDIANHSDRRLLLPWSKYCGLHLWNQITGFASYHTDSWVSYALHAIILDPGGLEPCAEWVAHGRQCYEDIGYDLPDGEYLIWYRYSVDRLNCRDLFSSDYESFERWANRHQAEVWIGDVTSNRVRVDWRNPPRWQPTRRDLPLLLYTPHDGSHMLAAHQMTEREQVIYRAITEVTDTLAEQGRLEEFDAVAAEIGARYGLNERESIAFWKRATLNEFEDWPA